jgi:hypothetical protein
MLLNRQVHMRSPMASNVMVAFCVSSSCLRHVIYVLGSACTCLRSISISLSLSLPPSLYLGWGVCSRELAFVYVLGEWSFVVCVSFAFRVGPHV